MVRSISYLGVAVGCFVLGAAAVASPEPEYVTCEEGADGFLVCSGLATRGLLSCDEEGVTMVVGIVASEVTPEWSHTVPWRHFPADCLP